MRHDDDQGRLSSDGLRRRDAMLELLLAAQRGEMLRRRRVARTMRATAACVVLAAVSAAAWMLRSPAGSVVAPRASEEPVAAQSGGEASPVPIEQSPSPTSLIVRVPGDPTVLDRLRAHGTGQTQWLDDDDLLQQLRANGRPTGLIRIDGRTILTADVTDKALAAPRS